MDTPLVTANPLAMTGHITAAPPRSPKTIAPGAMASLLVFKQTQVESSASCPELTRSYNAIFKAFIGFSTNLSPLPKLASAQSLHFFTISVTLSL